MFWNKMPPRSGAIRRERDAKAEEREVRGPGAAHAGTKPAGLAAMGFVMLLDSVDRS